MFCIANCTTHNVFINFLYYELYNPQSIYKSFCVFKTIYVIKDLHSKMDQDVRKVKGHYIFHRVSRLTWILILKVLSNIL